MEQFDTIRAMTDIGSTAVLGLAVLRTISAAREISLKLLDTLDKACTCECNHAKTPTPTPTPTLTSTDE